MSVLIELDTIGRLILDFSEEPTLARDPNFNDIILAFPVVSRTPIRLVLDLPGQITTSVDYIRSRIEALHIGVVLSSELESLLDRYYAELELIDEIRRIADTTDHANSLSAMTIPGLLSSAALLPHQLRGLYRLLNNHNMAEFSIQGSGKTAIVLSAFSYWRSQGEVEHLLVIGPISCFQPWEDEIRRCFGSSLSVIRWSGSLSERIRLVRAFASVDVVLCSYDVARRDVMMLCQLLRSHKTLLVLDESHYIKNFGIGARGAAVLQLAPYAVKRVILTGTPSPHSLFDLWTQFAFLWPNGSRVLLGNPLQYQEFLEGSQTPARDLRARLSPFYHRTTQSELNLPPLESHVPRIAINQIPPEQTRIINLLETRILAEARLRLSSYVDRDILAQWQRARIIRLLQAASNPGLLLNPLALPPQVRDVDFGELIGDVVRFQRGELVSAKIRWAVETTNELIRNGNKVVIWTWWVENLHLLSRLLASHDPLLLYGAIKPYEEETDDIYDQSRERNIREFKTRSDRPILLANPAACAEAISLHRECHHAIYVDRTFNCGQFLQSLNRIYRVGLPSNITTHYWIPILECAIERSVDQRLGERQQTMYEFLGDETPVIGIDVIEESDIAENSSELDYDFRGTIREIENGTQQQSDGQDTANP
jgi:SNF2 family DNA or RNA helicase